MCLNKSTKCGQVFNKSKHTNYNHIVNIKHKYKIKVYKRTLFKQLHGIYRILQFKKEKKTPKKEIT